MEEHTILVIDDDAVLLRLAELTFAHAGFRVVTASSGPEGLRLFYVHHPDLVVLDVMMPGMDGWEVCERLRQFSDVPIIMLSALSRNKDLIRGLEAGADEYMTKPFNPGILLAKTRAILRRAALSSPARE